MKKLNNDMYKLKQPDTQIYRRIDRLIDRSIDPSIYRSLFVLIHTYVRLMET